MTAGSSHWILVVDDEEDVREAVAEALRAEGYTVSTAANGRDALAELKAADSPPCVVLLDMMMPVMGGAELLRALGESAWADLPVIVVSGHSELALGGGARRILRKPVTFETLTSAVREFCGGPGEKR